MSALLPPRWLLQYSFCGLFYKFHLYVLFTAAGLRFYRLRHIFIDNESSAYYAFYTVQYEKSFKNTSCLIPIAPASTAPVTAQGSH
jgi:hypothetical protein